MNQIIPAQNQYPSALANEIFNMSANVQNVSNIVNNHSKSQHGGKRPLHTSGGGAFHSSGFEGAHPGNQPQDQYNETQQFNQLNNLNHNQEFLQRGFQN